MLTKCRYFMIMVLSLALVGLACPNAFAAKYVIKFASYFGPTHPATKAMESFKENLEKASKGEIEVQLYPNNQLGGEEQLMDHVKRGTVQIALVGGLIKKDEPKIAVMEAPFIIDTWKQAKEIYSGKGAEILVGNYTKNTNVLVKGFFVNGFRQISCRFPVENLTDIGKMKIRTPINDVFVMTFKALGANPVIIPMNELYNALETKVADGQDNPYSTVRANGWWEVQSNMLETRHMFSAAAVLVNGKFYEKLPAELQKAFDACMKDTVELNWKLSEQDDADSRAFLESKGIKIVEPSAEQKKLMREKMKPVYEWFAKEIPGSQEFIEFCQNIPQ